MRRPCLAIVLVLGFFSSVLSQGVPATRNLGAYSSYAAHGNWLAYSVFESFAGQDLNGDGDAADRVLRVHNVATGEITNLRLAAGYYSYSELSKDWFVFAVSEADQGTDLNDDGDTEDEIVHFYNIATGQTSNLRWQSAASYRPFRVAGDRLVLRVSERQEGEDLNGDGDREDEVLHVHNLVTGQTSNLRLAADWQLEIAGEQVVFSVLEQSQGQDLNHDGHRTYSVLHIHNLATNETVNLGFVVNNVSIGDLLSGHWLVLEVAELGEDLNGDGDTDDSVFHVHDFATGETTNLQISTAHETALLAGDWLAFPAMHGDQRGREPRPGPVRIHNLSTGQTKDLGLRGFAAHLSDRALLTGVSEPEQGEDLNGDGDTDDMVFHIHNLSTSETLNLRLAAAGMFAGSTVPSGDWLTFVVSETAQGEDLNGDGDRDDRIIHVHNVATHETKNRGFFVRTAVLPPGAYGRLLSDVWMAFDVYEADEGHDLNGDGDLFDRVVHVHNLPTAETANLQLSGTIFESIGARKWLVLGVGEHDEGPPALPEVRLDVLGYRARSRPALARCRRDAGAPSQCLITTPHAVKACRQRRWRSHV